MNRLREAYLKYTHSLRSVENEHRASINSFEAQDRVIFHDRHLNSSLIRDVPAYLRNETSWERRKRYFIYRLEDLEKFIQNTKNKNEQASMMQVLNNTYFVKGNETLDVKNGTVYFCPYNDIHNKDKDNCFTKRCNVVSNVRKHLPSIAEYPYDPRGKAYCEQHQVLFYKTKDFCKQ